MSTWQQLAEQRAESIQRLLVSQLHRAGSAGASLNVAGYIAKDFFRELRELYSTDIRVAKHVDHAVMRIELSGKNLDPSLPFREVTMQANRVTEAVRGWIAETDPDLAKQHTGDRLIAAAMVPDEERVVVSFYPHPKSPLVGHVNEALAVLDKLGGMVPQATSGETAEQMLAPLAQALGAENAHMGVTALKRLMPHDAKHRVENLVFSNSEGTESTVTFGAVRRLEKAVTTNVGLLIERGTKKAHVQEVTGVVRGMDVDRTMIVIRRHRSERGVRCILPGDAQSLIDTMFNQNVIVHGKTLTDGHGNATMVHADWIKLPNGKMIGQTSLL